MINWKEIWEIHCPHFKNDHAVIPLSKNLSFRLRPGPGFGDLSHPTTKLLLHFMKPLVKGKTVIDIGSGSGILSIAAKLLGAKEVYAFEIDEDAIHHSLENFKLNDLKIFLNKKPPHVDLVTINMISSEQKIALEQYPFIKEFPTTILSSGLLLEEKEAYLKEMSSWSLVRKKKQKGWLGLHLKSK